MLFLFSYFVIDEKVSFGFFKDNQLRVNYDGQVSALGKRFKKGREELSVSDFGECQSYRAIIGIFHGP